MVVVCLLYSTGWVPFVGWYFKTGRYLRSTVKTTCSIVFRSRRNGRTNPVEGTHKLHVSIGIELSAGGARADLSDDSASIERVQPSVLRTDHDLDNVDPTPVNMICMFPPPRCGLYVSVRRTRLNVLVLLTLTSAGSHRPVCILHEGIHTP